MTALVTGIANEHMVAYGCGKAFRELGADLAMTHTNKDIRDATEPFDELADIWMSGSPAHFSLHLMRGGHWAKQFTSMAA